MLTSERKSGPPFMGVGQSAVGRPPGAGPGPDRWRRGCQCLLLALGSGLLIGCATPGHRSNGLLDQALGVLGLQRADVTAPTQPPAGSQTSTAPLVTRRVTLRVHAGQVLNLGETGTSLPVVLRLYKLRNREAFEQLPYAAFSRAAPADLANFTSDIVETRELVFLPGQRHEVIENLEPQVRFIAVVGLFRSPAPQRWRAIFDAQSAAPSSITLGLHGCALSVAAGQALDMAPELMRVAGVRCEGA